MRGMRVANAPCSWGVLEFESTALAPKPSQVLDEIASTGYVGTELGDWGFLGTDAASVRAEVERRNLALVGAFVAVALSDPRAHDAGEAVALKTARLLAGATAAQPPLVLSDATAAVPARTAKAGRITAAEALDADGWTALAAGAERIASAVRRATGLPTVFHHHCATYVETPDEIDTLMRRTSPDVLGLCIDTGHATYGGGDPLAILSRHADRVWHVHFKDCDPRVFERMRGESWDYFEAMRHGIFCELGRGRVDFPAVLRELRARGYDDWIVVEQDVLPGMGSPADSARRNREFLRGLGV